MVVGEMGVEEAIARVMHAWENSPGTSPDTSPEASPGDKDNGSDKNKNKDTVKDNAKDKDSVDGSSATNDDAGVGQSEVSSTDSHPSTTTNTTPTPRSTLSSKRPVATPLPPLSATPTRAAEAIDVADTPLAHASVIGK